MYISVFAEVVSSGAAGLALSARDEVRRYDPVTYLHRLTHAVSLHAFSKLKNFSYELVTLTRRLAAGCRCGRSFPVFDVRTAYISTQYFYQYCAVLNFGNRLLCESEFLLSFKKNNFTFHLSSPRSGKDQSETLPLKISLFITCSYLSTSVA